MSAKSNKVAQNQTVGATPNTQTSNTAPTQPEAETPKRKEVVPTHIAWATVPSSEGPMHDTVTTHDVVYNRPNVAPMNEPEVTVMFAGTREIQAGKALPDDKAKYGEFTVQDVRQDDDTMRGFDLPPVLRREEWTDDDGIYHAPVYLHEGPFTVATIKAIPGIVAGLRAKLDGLRKRQQYLAMGRTRVLADALALAYNRSAGRKGETIDALEVTVNIAGASSRRDSE